MTFDPTKCECGGKLYLVVVHSTDIVQDDSGQNIRITDSEEVWRCPGCGSEFIFDADLDDSKVQA